MASGSFHMQQKATILNKEQIKQKINRLAYQVYEENYDEKEMLVIGIADRGAILAKRLVKKLKAISDIKITLSEIKINKRNPIEKLNEIKLSPGEYKNKNILIVDDVLNTGKVLMYACGYFLSVPIKKMQTLVLVDRNHHHFPISATFVGVSLSTTLKEHVSVMLSEKGDEDVAYLT